MAGRVSESVQSELVECVLVHRTIRNVSTDQLI